VVERDVISEELWSRIEPLLPVTAPQRGGRWRPHREIVEAIAWRFRTGDLNWLVSIDSTIVRAHRHAAGVAGRTSASSHPPGVHASADARGRGVPCRCRLARCFSKGVQMPMQGRERAQTDVRRSRRAQMRVVPRLLRGSCVRSVRARPSREIWGALSVPVVPMRQAASTR
jgi:hypothetical protein